MQRSTEVSSVLVVDDSEGDALLAELVLKENLAEARVDHANDGEAALELLLTEAYDLVLLDLAMPGLSGFDVLQELSGRETFDTRVVVLTSSTRPSDQERVASYGCEYVEKHTDFSTFRRSIARTLTS